MGNFSLLSNLCCNAQLDASEIFILLEEYDLGGRTSGWQRWSHKQQY
ncbi:hypothetical protein PT287_01435 [Lactobacillus sp. ESL0679]|nr:hypothetical protein [Lactobacillus sp. ESL0679]